MGLTNFPDGINAGDEAGNAGTLAIGGTAITVTADQINALGTGLGATELDYLDGAIAGTAVENKALVVKAGMVVDTVDITSPKFNGVAITASAAEINTLGGVLGAKVLSYDSATAMVVASGSTAITGIGTVATGLGGAVQRVIASLANSGTPAGTAAWYVYARPSGSSGAVIFECFDFTGTAATAPGTVEWVALGTAAA